MQVIKDFKTAKRILSSKEEFGPPNMYNYIELIEKESGIDFTELKRHLKMFLPFMHGKEHLDIRKPVNKIFTHLAIERFNSNIIEAIEYRLNEIEKIKNDSIDLIVDICDNFYIDMTEILFGVKISDRKEFIKQIEIATKSVERMASVSQFIKLQNVLIDLNNLIIKQYDNFPANSLFKVISEHTKNIMTKEEIVSLLIVLLIAPRATTETISHIMVAYSEMEDEKIRKYSSFEWVNNHVDDLIRLYASTNLLSKETKKDVKINGKIIPKGTQVLIDIPSINRDNKQYGEQVELEKIDDYSPSISHLTFGSGSHKCLGAELSKNIIKEFIPRFFEKFPIIKCDLSKQIFYKAEIATRIKNLPAKFIESN